MLGDYKIAVQLNDTKMEARKHVTQLHTDRVEWLKKLMFYKDDLATQLNRLAEVVQNNKNIEVTSMAEHFQNHLIRQLEVNDELRHEINDESRLLAETEAINPVATDRKLATDYTELRDKVETYEKLFNELRHEFNTFVSKTL